MTVYHLAQWIRRLCGSSSAIEFVRWDHPDVELRVPSVAKARELLKWEPRFDLDEGLTETIAWYRHKLEAER